MIKKSIEKTDWQDRLQAFVSGNLKRKSSLSVNENLIASNVELLSIDYDPEGKGNDLMISLEGCGHTIDSPEEIILVQKDNGEVSAFEVTDEKGLRHILSFQ